MKEKEKGNEDRGGGNFRRYKGKRMRKISSGRGRRDQRGEIKENSNNKYVDFSKQMFRTLNLKTTFRGGGG